MKHFSMDIFVGNYRWRFDPSKKGLRQLSTYCFISKADGKEWSDYKVYFVYLLTTHNRQLQTCEPKISKNKLAN